MNAPLIKSRFHFEHSPEWEGYHFPAERWNGWRCPRFDEATTIEIMQWMNVNNPDSDYVATWVGNQFVEVHKESGENVAVGPDVNGLYDLGSMGWTWEEVES